MDVVKVIFCYCYVILVIKTVLSIDSSEVPVQIDNEAVEEVTFIKDYYGEQHAKYVGNFMYCCHTLEHIQPTFEFINSLRRSIGYHHVPVFFELPVLPVFSRI